MRVTDEWILFLQENPEFFELSKSGFFISLLRSLASEAKSAEVIHSQFPFVAWSDIWLILNVLVKLDAVEQIRIGKKTFFKATAKGKQLLRMYKKIKEFFTV